MGGGGYLLSSLRVFTAASAAPQTRLIGRERQRVSAAEVRAWAAAKVSVYKTQKRYALEKASRCAAGRAEKR